MSGDDDPDDHEETPHQIPIEESIDLHFFAPAEIRSVVEEYVSAAREAGFKEVRVIHGRGKGVQRAAVQSVLEKLDAVEAFYDDAASGLGATLVQLRGKKQGAGQQESR